MLFFGRKRGKKKDKKGVGGGGGRGKRDNRTSLRQLEFYFDVVYLVIYVTFL